jgi:hypothetical protein
LKKLQQSGLSILPFPKGAAAELSMLDNCLFRDFKRDFAAELEKSKFDIDKKEEIAYQVWNAFPEQRIKGYWKKCGYHEKPRHRRNSLIQKGVTNKTS